MSTEGWRFRRREVDAFIERAALTGSYQRTELASVDTRNGRSRGEW
jgi:hypothetical protein